MKKLYICLALLMGVSLNSRASIDGNAQRVLGADISLVPAYEQAGDIWLDADGNQINSYYSDGMVTFLRDVAKWTSIRVRLLVDPSQDSSPATCQDLDYVKALGKRIKDAGMYFLLDIFYSDTWTDVTQQWIPAGWSMSRSTSTSEIAAKVKDYTLEVVNELVDCGAAPDYIQLGNEVSYGMLWDSASGANTTTNAFYLSSSYSTYQTQIERFTAILSAAAEAVRASEAADAKIILHCERTIRAAQCKNFYDYVEQGGFTDYDIIGLSYYPAWHGNLSNLQSTLTTLQTAYPDKEIQIVECGYYNNTYAELSSTESSYCTWDRSFEGQAAFLTDLMEVLNGVENVTGFYYWQPEECGNGANSAGENQVMDSWDNRGFWSLSWQSTAHDFSGAASVAAMQNFNYYELPSTGDDTDDADDEAAEDSTVTTDISTTSFENLDFESSTFTGSNTYADEVPGWSWIWDTDVTNNFSSLWVNTGDQWMSSLVSNAMMKSWAPSGTTIYAGKVIYQSSLAELPAGTYTLSAAVHTDQAGLYLYIGDAELEISSASAWGTAYTATVTTELTEAATLEIGLKVGADVTLGSEWNIYADNFAVTQTVTTATEEEGEEDAITSITADGTATKAIYDISGKRVTSPTSGLYIINGKKTIVK